MKLASTLGITALSLSLLVTASAKPLKVFILAGQSNMQGHARIETFDCIRDVRKDLNSPRMPIIIGMTGKAFAEAILAMQK